MTSTSKPRGAATTINEASLADCYHRVVQLRAFGSDDECRQLAALIGTEPNAREPQGIDPDTLSAVLRVSDEWFDEYNMLRYFRAVLRADPEDGMEEGRTIGTVTGHFSHRAHWQPLALELAGDAVSGSAEELGIFADQIFAAKPVDSVFLVERIVLDSDCQGHRLAGRILVTLMNLLQHDPSRTTAVLLSEPLSPLTAAPYPEGNTRSTALNKITKAYSESGLEPWQDGRVWWLPPARVVEIAQGLQGLR